MGIRVADVTKCFGDFMAVHDVSLDVETGSLVALLGPSGSGKSTLLRLIAGLETPDVGRIWITGQEATERSIQERNVGFVFQHFALFKHRNVRQNVAFGLELRGWKREAPAASGSASPWPAPWPCNHGCCCSMSHSAPSTTRCARSCAPGCAASTTRCT
jgi:ABC-type sulfate/molybdate transport systems ATPase subunit